MSETTETKNSDTVKIPAESDKEADSADSVTTSGKDRDGGAAFAEAASGSVSGVKAPESSLRVKSPAEKLFSLIYRHPIISAALVCILSAFIHGGRPTVPGTVLTGLLIAAAGCTGAYASSRAFEGKRRRQQIIAVSAVSLIGAAVFMCGVFIIGSSSIVVMNGGLAVCVGIFFYLLALNKLDTRSVILLLFAAGFIMRLSYILAMNASMIQHDVYYIGDGAGHSGYIEYLYANGHLPDFDVREVDQFYHPPLHHIISALWMHLQTLIGVPYEKAYENIQILTLFYSTVCLILSYKIFRRLGLSGSGLIIAAAIIAFCPTFYIMAGSINNDILSITFMLGAVLNTLYWYRSRTLKRILCIALCIGLGMMTKLSVWMVAPAVAVMFIYVFITEIRSFKKYLVQYAAFIFVCAPIGLFWSVRNFILWRVPFTYVQRLSEDSSQYVGDIPILSRLFDFSPYQFADVAPQFKMYGGSYNEFNPLTGFFKTSAFDEGIAVRRFPQIAGFNQVLFWSAVVLGLVGFCSMIYMLIKKSSHMDTLQKFFVATLYFTLLIMYYYFCIDFPHVCTMNVRYGVPMIVIGALSAGYLTKELFAKKSRGAGLCAGALCSVVGIYALSGYIVYNICAFMLIR